MAFTATDTQIANMAIRHLGEGHEISNLSTDDSEEAQACRTFFDQARDETLEIFDWNFARKTVALDLIEENPSDYWGFSFRVPSDCVRFRRVPSQAFPERKEDSIPFDTEPDDQGMIVLCNIAEPMGVYTFRQKNLGFWSSSAKQLLSLRLAFYIASSISEKPEKSVEMLGKFRALQPDATAISASQKQTGEPPLPGAIQARS